jgi:hypothetical protein
MACHEPGSPASAWLAGFPMALAPRSAGSRRVVRCLHVPRRTLSAARPPAMQIERLAKFRPTTVAFLRNTDGVSEQCALDFGARRAAASHTHHVTWHTACRVARGRQTSVRRARRCSECRALRARRALPGTGCHGNRLACGRAGVRCGRRRPTDCVPVAGWWTSSRTTALTTASPQTSGNRAPTLPEPTRSAHRFAWIPPSDRAHRYDLKPTELTRAKREVVPQCLRRQRCISLRGLSELQPTGRCMISSN